MEVKKLLVPKITMEDLIKEYSEIVGDQMII